MRTPPEKDRDRKQEVKNRSMSDTPPYPAHLPKVFPYRRQLTREDALTIVGRLMEVMGGDYGYHAPFAVTSHPRTTNGDVRLWLSKLAGDWCLQEGLLFYLDETIE